MPRVGRGPLLALALVGAVSAVSVVRATSAASSPQPAVPLATSLSNGGATFVSVPMGHLSQPLNTFWQLFELTDPAGHWLLDTPPGIADNGGLVVAGESNGAIDVGIRPSNLLHYTATIVENRKGAWSQSAVIPGTVLATADSIAGPAGAPDAAVSANGSEVLRASGSGWRAVADVRSLSSDGCHVQAITSIATSADDSLVIGATCLGGTRAGIFTANTGNWRLSGPRLSDLASSHARLVLRLADEGTSTEALIESSTGNGTSVVSSLQPVPGGAWKTSNALSIPSGANIVSVGPASGHSQFVVWSNGRLHAAISGPARWRMLPTLPSGTKTLAFPWVKRVDAMSVDGAKLTDWVLNPTGTAWIARQTINVPIEYGSSG
jgi:hypothetical protein